MNATAERLRLELIARIARPRLLAVKEHYAPLIERGEREGVSYWRQVCREECDEALDEAIDAADAAIAEHTLRSMVAV